MKQLRERGHSSYNLRDSYVSVYNGKFLSFWATLENLTNSKFCKQFLGHFSADNRKVLYPFVCKM